MSRIKLKLLSIAVVALFLTFITQGTLAYYTTIGKATNVITSGGIEMRIHETGFGGVEFPTEGVYVIPGDVVTKEVKVESLCKEPFYLRVKIIYGIDSIVLPSEECFKLSINTEHWEYHDGWYYYKDVVDEGEITPYVFSEVEIVGEKVNNHYIGKTLTLTVDAQAVQAKNNPITEGRTYTASGWPK